MKILSIDVGIKNLAFCLLEKNTENSSSFIIKKWDIINLSQEEILKCQFIEKNILCDKPAKYTKENKCFCLKHSKKQVYQLPKAEFKASYINKQKIQQLYDFADKYSIKYEKPIKKNELTLLIHEYIHNHCFEEIGNVNASKVNIISIGKNIQKKFQELFDSEGIIHHIIIENQISPIANRMKTIQGMIAQYFIMKNQYENIEFISASNKLKDFQGEQKDKEKDKEKDTYKDRKKLGINMCLETMEKNHSYHDKIEYFNKHNKKDDLADSFLQALWFINHKL